MAATKERKPRQFYKATTEQRDWLAWVSTPQGRAEWIAQGRPHPGNLVRSRSTPPPVVPPHYEEQVVNGRRRLVWYEE